MNQFNGNQIEIDINSMIEHVNKAKTGEYVLKSCMMLLTHYNVSYFIQ